MEADKRKMDQAAAKLVQLRKKIGEAEAAVAETSLQFARSEYECKRIAGAGDPKPVVSEPAQLAALLFASANCTEEQKHAWQQAVADGLAKAMAELQAVLVSTIPGSPNMQAMDVDAGDGAKRPSDPTDGDQPLGQKPRLVKDDASKETSAGNSPPEALDASVPPDTPIEPNSSGVQGSDAPVIHSQKELDDRAQKARTDAIAAAEEAAENDEL